VGSVDETPRALVLRTLAGMVLEAFCCFWKHSETYVYGIEHAM